MACNQPTYDKGPSKEGPFQLHQGFPHLLSWKRKMVRLDLSLNSLLSQSPTQGRYTTIYTHWSTCVFKGLKLQPTHLG
jgi:hypothetical protein